jgi:flavodoxin
VKTAIIYYSLGGNCALAAAALKDLFAGAGKTADLVEIKTVDAKRRRGFAKYAWGCSQVLLGKKPALRPLDFDPAGYDLLILGAPVWAGSPAPPAASFLRTVDLRGKRAALFCCHAGGKGRALEKFRALLPGAVIAGEIDLVNPAGNPGGLREKLRPWVESLGGPGAGRPRGTDGQRIDGDEGGCGVGKQAAP